MKIDYWRLLFKYNDSYHKICPFGEWEKDKSIFFELFSGEGKPMHELSGNVTKREKDESGNIYSNSKVSISDPKNTGFVSHKTSFHPSGIFLSKNKQQEIYKKGISTLPFDKINGFLQIMALLPKHYSEFPIVEIEKKNDVVFNTTLFDNNPLQIDVFVLDDKGVKPPVPFDTLKSEDIYLGTHDGPKLFVRVIQNDKHIQNGFPPNQTIIQKAYTPIDTDRNP